LKQTLNIKTELKETLRQP